MTNPQMTMEFLCDGGSKPNPGWAQPIVHDGTRFLVVPFRQVLGNHKAIYESVDFALEYAFNNNATDVVISTAANLVYNQLASEIMLDVLVGRHSATSGLAHRFNSVEWVLISPPFNLPARPPVRSRKALRRMGRRAVATPKAAT